jgi:hypothetical protein
VPAKIRLSDGREITVMLSGKRVVDELRKASNGDESFARFNSSPMQTAVWINPRQVAAVEDRPDLAA